MVSSDYLPRIGGIAAHIFNLSKALRALGDEVVVIHPVGRIANSPSVSDPEVPCLRVPVATTGRIRHYISTYSCIHKALSKVEHDLGTIDVVHQHDGIDSVAAIWRGRRRAAWVWTNHSSTFVMAYRSSVRRMMYRLAYHGCDGVISVSDEILRMSRDIWPRKRSEFIPNGVDTLRFRSVRGSERARYGLEPQDYVVLCPRRMVPKNGVEFLAAAIPQVLEAAPDVAWRFVFVDCEDDCEWNQSYRLKVVGRLKRDVPAGAVRMLGAVPMSDMPALNQLADVVVIPSLVEAVSLSALEAMAMERPVVASDVGGLGQLIRDGETGVLVPPGNSAALARSIVMCFRDQGRSHEMAKRASEVARGEYSWGTVALRTREFYRAVIAGKLPSSGH